VTPKPFSPETLAAHWGCSSEKIRQMCRRGELSYFRLGKLIRIPANEVERVECQNTALSDIEANGALLTGDHAFGLRLERLTEGSRKLALVKSGAPSPSQSPRG
jgi:excisionase family DNA binding protein